MWLSWIQHLPVPAAQGEPQTAAPLPPVFFQGEHLPNLVEADADGKQLLKQRLTLIRNELGGRIRVSYGHERPCAPGNLPANAFSSVGECFAPRRPGGTDDNLTWYHKYVVKNLTLTDQAVGLESLGNNDPSLGTTRQYRYTYRGDPGWRYNGSSKNVPAKFRSWSDWRGYQTTLIRTMAVNKQSNAGQPLSRAKSVRRVVVYRGMYNSRKNNTTTDLRTTSADGAYVATVERGLSSTQLPDRNALRGRIAEETVLEPPNEFCSSGCAGKWITRTYHGYKVWRTALNNMNLAAYFTGESMTRTHDRVTRETGTRRNWDRRHTINRTFNDGGTSHRGLALGTITSIIDRGASTSDDPQGDKNTCTNTSWVGNSARWLIVPIDVQVLDQTSGSTCTELRSRVGSFYDGVETQTGSALTRGRVTRVETYTDANNKIVTRTGYDTYGRVSSTQDGKGFNTSTTYNLSESGETADDLPVKVTTTTNQSQVVTRYEKRRGLPVAVTDFGNSADDGAAGSDDARTTTTYDGYGRVLSLRTPNVQGAGGDDSVTYEYSVSSSANRPARVKTATRRANGVLDTSFDYIDGWGRLIETQMLQADGVGRIVSATGYNELGLPYLEMPVVANADAPGSGLLNARQDAAVRHEVTNYDAAGRVIREWHMGQGGAEKYSTFYSPQGDRVITTQPVVGAKVEFFDGWNRTWKVQQYRNNDVDVAASREHSATYTYDGLSNLRRVTSTLQGVDQQWDFGFDFAGRRVSTNDPDTGSSTSAYDANGNKISTSSTEDGVVKTLYDNQDRAVKQFKVLSGDPSDCANSGTQADCERIYTWSYDTAIRGDGRLSAMSSYSQLGIYTQAITSYDLNGNALAETYTYPANIDGGSPSGTVSLANIYSYNDADLVTAVNYGTIGNLPATSVTTTYGTNAQVDIMTATQSGQPAVTLLDATYDKAGRPLRALSETGNANKRLNREYAWENSTGRLARLGGSAFGTLDYTYDLIGNTLSATEHNLYSNAPPDYVTAAWCYSYEGLNRLKSVKTGNAASNSCASPASSTTLIGANQNLTYSYTADRLASVSSGVGGTSSSSAYAYSTAKPHQLTQITGGAASDPALPQNGTFAYDTAGRVKTITPGTGPVTVSTYNPTGTLKTSVQSGTSGISSSYAYNPDGLRVARRDTVSGSSGYVNSVRYFGDSELTVKTPNGGSTITNGRRVFTTPGGKPLAIQAGTGTSSSPGAPIWTLQLGDGQNSLRFTRDQTAGIDSRPTYRPFGEAISTSSSGERGYLNLPQDPNGDVRLDHRNYSPKLNVLTTPDPLLNIDDPQTLNPYAYAKNNPVALSDPTGLEPWPCALDPEYDGPCTSYTLPTDTTDPVQNEAAAAVNEILADPDYVRPDTDIGKNSAVPRAIYNFFIGDTVNSCTGDFSSLGCGANIATSTPFTKWLKVLKYGDDVVDLARGADEAAEAVSDTDKLLDAADTSVPQIKPGASGGESAGQKFSKKTREEALEENPDTCVYCRMTTDKPQIDHSIPRSRGGDATLENAQTTCGHCNASKGNRDHPVTPPPGYAGAWPPPWWPF